MKFSLKQKIGMVAAHLELSHGEIAKETGLHKNTISKVFNDMPVSRDTVKSIERYIDIKGYSFFDDGYIATPYCRNRSLAEIRNSLVLSARMLDAVIKEKGEEHF